MGITVDGNSLIIDNATITLNNAFDPSTGIATLTITPSGGLGTLPGLLEGQPGLPPILRNITLNQVPSGTALPANPAQWTLVSPGGPGVAAIYDLTLYLNEGAQGPSGAAGPLTGLSDVVGTVEHAATVIWNDAEGAFNFVSALVSQLLSAAASSTSGNSYSRTLATATVPAQNNPWIPLPFGQAIISGTANTTVNLTANLNSTTGPVVGVGYGVAGAGVPTFLLPNVAGDAGNTANVTVAAGQAATIYLVATQINNSTTDSWTTSQSTTSFSVQTLPVLSL
ncbi:hypothetical protein E2F47_23490 [Mycobacterium eburneum]|nr:hypothetical protein [Mycobacterium eburneum]TDH48484.1 hypothetical protein E2F47_23490 [Mycobacterium eburneum]